MLLRLAGFKPLLEPLSANDLTPAHGEMHQSRHAAQLATEGILNVRLRAAHVERRKHEILFERRSERKQCPIGPPLETAAPLQVIAHVRATISSGKPCSLMKPPAA